MALLEKPDPNWTIKIGELTPSINVFLLTPYSSEYQVWNVLKISTDFYATFVNSDISFTKDYGRVEFTDRFTDLTKTLLLADDFKCVTVQYRKTEEIKHESTSHLQP